MVTRAGAQPRDLVGGQRRDVQHDVARRRARRRSTTLGAGVARTRRRTTKACAPAPDSTDDLEAGLDQPADGVRRQRDPALTGALLGDDSDPHDR